MIQINEDRLLERFLRYVAIDTMAVEDADTYPSSSSQLELGKLIVEEMRAMGISDATQDEHGIVMGTVPGTADPAPPTIAFCAHLDTSPETSGANIKPQIIRNYAGGDIPLPGDSTKVITLAENPELNDLHGSTIITTDGTTLLGADDKAGLAAILEAAQCMLEAGSHQHGPVRLLFTCDEEIGRGVDHIDLAKVNATACYTLDGGGSDVIDEETFSADLAIVRCRGINIHPSIAKGKMVNAIKIAAHFLQQLPRDMLSPETTEDREGFVHPYVIDGGVAEVQIKILLRDFDTPKLAEHAEYLRSLAKKTMQEFPRSEVDVEVREQYRNMAGGLAKEPRAVAYAVAAHEKLGRTPRKEIIRGGTDGSRLTELGLPTPNLATGEHNPHSPLEWTCLEEMSQAASVVCAIAEVWAEKG
ncbi:MAG: peptidase T [Pirellulales bacterium]|nr:peptidase T [Pirellulales bacterium]